MIYGRLIWWNHGRGSQSRLLPSHKTHLTSSRSDSVTLVDLQIRRSLRLKCSFKLCAPDWPVNLSEAPRLAPMAASAGFNGTAIAHSSYTNRMRPAGCTWLSCIHKGPAVPARLPQGEWQVSFRLLLATSTRISSTISRLPDATRRCFFIRLRILATALPSETCLVLFHLRHARYLCIADR